jgi:uncharacterized protein
MYAVMEPLKIIQRYYDIDSKSYRYLTKHSEKVTKKALDIAMRIKGFSPDIKFIEEAAMLHDIGIFLTKAPSIGCRGDKPYICHGFLGREILEKEGLPKHALVCENHIGVGITVDEIEKNNLPLPKREIGPTSLEERIICFADKFYSKVDKFLLEEKSIEIIKKGLSRFGNEKLDKFNKMLDVFGV